MASIFGDALRRIRFETKTTLVDVSKAVGCSIAYVSAVERGEKNPFSDKIIEKILEALGRPEESEKLIRLARSSFCGRNLVAQTQDSENAIRLSDMKQHLQIFTVGYGGRTRESLGSLLHHHHIKAIVDVRLRPDRASMSIWVKAKTPDKGIEKTLADLGVGYVSVVELGNVFYEQADWEQRYQQLLEQSGELLLDRLKNIAGPYCLLCAEKKASECHRRLIADYLARHAKATVTHLE